MVLTNVPYWLGTSTSIPLVLSVVMKVYTALISVTRCSSCILVQVPKFVLKNFEKIIVTEAHCGMLFYA